MKILLICLIFVSVSLCYSSELSAHQQLKTMPLSDVAQQLSKNIFSVQYSMTTQQGFNMDCLKVINKQNSQKLGVFHSSKGQTDTYNRLYAAIQPSQNQKYKVLSRLSQRGSQGTIFSSQVLNGGYLIAYELQNKQHGNTFALRYYQNYENIKINNFLYEYQLQQKTDNINVRNIGTPSIQSIQITKKQSQQRFNQYLIRVKFHYSPDGSRDLPGFGYVNLRPLRDFVDSSGNWLGGCRQKYPDWKGTTDSNVLNAMRKIGVTGKIGQRDSFTITSRGKPYKYFLYEANLYSDFNWKNWRIFLYGQTQNQVLPIPFVLDKVVDLANPHISLSSINGTQIVFQMSSFLPSEGMQPLSSASPGQVLVKTILNL